MSEAVSSMTYLFRKLLSFLFDTATVTDGATVGYIILATALTTAVIGTIAPRIIQGNINSGNGRQEGDKGE